MGGLKCCRRAICSGRLPEGWLSTLAANAWPTEQCDGFWVTLGAEGNFAGFGGYHSTYQGFGTSLKYSRPLYVWKLTGGSCMIPVSMPMSQ